MDNIVIFGATQSGKTTLLGYLSSKSLSDTDFSVEANDKYKKINSMALEGGFKKRMILPSFVSMDKDELKKFIDLNAIGTTKRIHRRLVTINIESHRSVSERCIFIDTPGIRIKVSEKYQGIFEGDTGIAVISIIDMENYISYEKDNNEDININSREPKKSLERRLFEPIQIWCLYKSAKKLIIVLSKIDTIKNKETIYKSIECIKNVIRSVSDIDVPIIPISINVDIDSNNLSPRNPMNFTRHECNIYDPCEQFKNNGLNHFMSVLADMLNKNNSLSIEKSFKLASIDRPVHPKVNNKIKTALRIKVLHGNLKLNTIPQIGPITHKDYESHIYLHGKISSLKNEDEKPLANVLSEGSIGGVIFDKLYSDINMKREVKISDCVFKKSTIVTAGKTCTGDVLNFCAKFDELSESSEDALNRILPKEQIDLYWYGKKMPLDLVEYYYDNTQIFISLSPLNESLKQTISEFVMPLDEENGDVLCSEFLLGISDPVEKNARNVKDVLTFTYVTTLLNDLILIKDYNAVSLTFEGELLFNPMNSLTRLSQCEKMPSQNNRHSFIFNKIAAKNLGNFYKALRSFVKENIIYEYSLRLNP